MGAPTVGLTAEATGPDPPANDRLLPVGPAKRLPGSERLEVA